MDQITPSVQDYLKIILELSADEQSVHSTDVASRLGVSRASVSRAMNGLKQDGYIDKEKYGTIRLTPSGLKAARQVKERNELIKRFLIDVLHVTKNTAIRDACRMEHTISSETAEKLQQYLESTNFVGIRRTSMR